MAEFTSPTGLEVQERLHQFYSSTVSCLNTSELNILLVQEKVLSAQEACLTITSPELLVQKLEQSGLWAYQKLYSCILKERHHLGHRYIQAVLENKLCKYASDEDMKKSMILKGKLELNLTLLAGCNLQELLTHMYSKELLTSKEWKKLQAQVNDTNELLLHIAVILDTKGPLAYTLFADCLHSIDCAIYAQLFEEVEPRKSSSRKSRSEQREVAVFQTPPPKRPLPRLKLHGCLKGTRYNRIMKMFQECHHNGKWTTIEEEASKLSTSSTPKALRVVALLERAVSWVFRRNEKHVLDLVADARKLCTEVEGDNATFLDGRCEYILSRLYRYLQQYDKAQEHIRRATYILHMAEPGEDSAFVHYCDACIRVEKLSKNTTKKELQHAQWSYEYAIDHAQSHNSGLDLVAPHSFMRLAQMHLGSSHYSAGSQTDKESISKASNCLAAVDKSSLAHRSLCHYLIIHSDLQRCQQDTQNARASAHSALEIAQTYNFTLEITSAEKRLDSL